MSKYKTIPTEQFVVYGQVKLSDLVIEYDTHSTYEDCLTFLSNFDDCDDIEYFIIQKQYIKELK